MNGGVTIPDKDTAKALNDLARHKAIVRILNDIRMDMEICEIEGWDKNEYLNLIRQLLNSIGDKTMSDLIDRQAAIDALDCISGVEEVLRSLPPAQPKLYHTQKFCEYCNVDSDGYAKPIEKNNHAFIQFGMDGWVLRLNANGWHGSEKIRYCPMCGRDLFVK